MDKISQLSRFLEENFPERAEEMKETLNELKEVLLSTNLDISESMTDLMLDNEYNKARNYIDKSEDISNYIKKLEDIMELVHIKEQTKTTQKEEAEEEVKPEKINEINKKEVKQEKEQEKEKVKINTKQVYEEKKESKDFDPAELYSQSIDEDKKDQTENEVFEEEIESQTSINNEEEEIEDTEEKNNTEKMNQEEISQMFKQKEKQYKEPKIHYLDENFREQEPSAFYIGEQGKEVESWSEMLVETCKMLKNRDPDKFVAFINDDDFKFISRSYFSYNKDQITEPEPMQLKNRKIYIETKLSPNVVNKLIQKLVNSYNIDQRDYKIYYQGHSPMSAEDKKIS